MKIVKDDIGYFIVDNNFNKVNLIYKGETVQKLPSLAHIALCRWHSNERYNTVQTKFNIVINYVDKFKCAKYYIADYLKCDVQELPKMVKKLYPEDFI
jgi:hypothetical protein